MDTVPWLKKGLFNRETGFKSGKQTKFETVSLFWEIAEHLFAFLKICIIIVSVCREAGSKSGSLWKAAGLAELAGRRAVFRLNL